MRMKIKHVLASPYCWLTARIRIPYDYVEKLRILCTIYKYRTSERFIQDLVCERIDAERDIIEERRQKEEEEEKRFQEEWKIRMGIK